MVYENTEHNEYYCLPIPFNFAFAFLIFSWICVPGIVACQILIYSSALSTMELHENLKLQKSDLCQRLNQLDAQMLEIREDITEHRQSIFKLWSRHLLVLGETTSPLSED